MKSFLLVCCFLFSTIASADFYSAKEAESALKKFSSKSFELKDPKAIEKMEDDIIDALDDAAIYAAKAPKNNDLNKELVRVAIVLIKHDYSNYGAELILPIYKKYENDFIALIKNLPKSDAQLLEEKLESAKREADKGND